MKGSIWEIGSVVSIGSIGRVGSIIEKGVWEYWESVGYYREGKETIGGR